MGKTHKGINEKALEVRWLTAGPGARAPAARGEA